MQKAYLISKGKLPIEDGVDVISVGTSFLRFLAVADQIKKPVTVVTDNDGNVEALNKKYSAYLSGQKSYIQVCFDTVVDSGGNIDGKEYNYNTLEPKLLKLNGCKALNEIFGTNFDSDDDMRRHMRANKTACALKVFETDKSIHFPKYILDAVA